MKKRNGKIIFFLLYIAFAVLGAVGGFLLYRFVGCGWLAFSKPIEAPAVVERHDNSYGMNCTEVRSWEEIHIWGTCSREIPILRTACATA